MITPSLRRSIGWLYLCLLLVGLARGQSADVAKDPRLQKPLSIKLKISPIDETLTALSKLAGVPLERSLSIKDLKVTVLVNEVPAGLVLEKIAKTLGCEWKADKEVLRLVMTADEQNARSRYIEAEESVAQKEIVDELSPITHGASMDRAAAENELIEQAQAKDGAAQSKVKYDPKRVELLNYAINRQDVMLGRMLLNLTADKVTSFWRGEVVSASPALVAEVAAEAQTQHDGIPSTAQRRGRLDPVINPNSVPLFIQYDPLLFRVQVLQGFGVRTISKRLGQIVTEPIPTGTLAKMPFGKSVVDWDQSVPTDGDFTKLDVLKSSSRSMYSNHLYSIADFLEKAFDQTKVPIIADAFRVPAFAKDFDQGVGAFTGWLSLLKKDNHLMTRFEDGFVMVRHGGFWRLRKFETPEDLLRSLESKVSKTGPTLEDFGSFVSKLTPEQAKPFGIKSGALSRFDANPFEVGLPALKFISTLDREAITLAMANGLSFMQMSAAQRIKFAEAAVEGVFLGAAPSSYFSTLYRFAVSGDGRGLGFLIRADEVQVNADRVHGQDLLFGSNFANSTTYKLPVAE